MSHYPICNCSDASMFHRVEGIQNMKFCSSCDELFGIDDSMNVDDLRQLMEEDKVCFKTVNSCSCGNDDLDAFLFEECQQPGEPHHKCRNCNLELKESMKPSQQYYPKSFEPPLYPCDYDPDECLEPDEELARGNPIMAESATEAISASDIESLVDVLPDFLADINCPNCKSSDASMYRQVEGMKTVKYCSSCDTLFGIDDTMSVNDLRQFMEEGKLRFQPADSCACGNDDVNAFLIEQCQQSGKLYLKCTNCNLTKDIEIIPSDVDVKSEDTEDSFVCDDRLVVDDGLSSACHTFEDQIPRQRYQPFTCECGKEENELFEKRFDASGNSLVSVRCWSCDRQTKLWTNKENYCLIECDKCGNNMKDLFDKTFDYGGQIVDIFCHKCETHLQLNEFMKPIQQINSSESHESPLFIAYKKTKVTSLGTLKRGDHVAWKRCLGIYWHHAIVVVVLSENELEVIHSTVAEDAKYGAKCKILRGKEKVDLGKGDLYVCNYKPGECLEPDKVIAHAVSLLGEKIYHLFLSNCEHFATLCKTARCFSNQVTSFITVAMTLIGQLLIPIPIVGYFIGRTIGDILEHCIGEKGSKRFRDILFRKLPANDRRHETTSKA